MQLLKDLSSSFRSSQSALLARDIRRIEQLTQEQAEAHRALSSFLETSHSSGSLPSAIFSGPRGNAVRLEVWRVLKLGRIQSILLSRAQQSLQTLSHLLAGTQYVYAPAVSSLRMPARPADKLFEPSEEG